MVLEPEGIGVDSLERGGALGTVGIVVAGDDDGSLSRGSDDGGSVDADWKKRAVRRDEGGWTRRRDQYDPVDPLFSVDLWGGEQPQGDAAAVSNDDPLSVPQLGKLAMQDGEPLVQRR